MKNLQYFLNVIDFLGDDMTDEQASDLMDQAKEHLSISEIEYLLTNTSTSPNMHTEFSMYDAEMGGLSRY